MMKQLIKPWYTATYPTDELGKDFHPDCTFEEVWESIEDVYEIIGAADSIVRERVFQMISELLAVDYSVVYNKWLYGSNFEEWIESDNVVCTSEDQYITQCTQWNRKFNWEELFQYFLREFKD